MYQNVNSNNSRVITKKINIDKKNIDMHLYFFFFS